jgi:transposase
MAKSKRSKVGGKRRRAGRPRIIDARGDAHLLELVQNSPHISTRELVAPMTVFLERPVSHDAITKSLARLGVKKRRLPRAPAVPAARRHGYTAAHRRARPEGKYPSSCTDLEWDLVKDLFERPGPGRPGTHTRRDVFDAVLYALRSGCAWRMLPGDFPPWQTVYATFRRWSEAGYFEEMNDRFRRLWREREGRDAEPTATVIDSQSVRTAEKGGPTVLTARKK